MILLIDDDTDLLDMLTILLRRDGLESRSFNRAEEAITYLKGAPPPDLIVSDIMMEGMDGFGFRREVTKIPLMSNVPFFFISSFSDEETIVRGLDEGADQYITKPVIPAVFRARVRALLRRHQSTVPTFRGDLSRLSFPQLFQFCETKHLTGEVSISHGEFSITLNFMGGELDVATIPDADRALEALYDLEEGLFCISQHVTDFDEIRSSQVLAPVEEKRVLAEKPMGALSGVTAGKKLVQVQTEYASTPAPAVVTIVVYNGKTIHKKETRELPDFTKEGVEAVIREQHAAVETHIRTKLASVTSSETEEPPAEAEDFQDLFNRGLKLCMAKNYDDAFALWSRAQKLDPEHNLLQINMKILKRKMEEQPLEDT